MTGKNALGAIITTGLMVVAIAQAGCRNTSAPSLAAIKESPSLYPGADKWASPRTVKGLPNLHCVSDDLYRGAQPTDEGFAQLSKMGVKTVVNLRTSDDDVALLKDRSLGYHHIPMTALDIRDADVIEFLRIAVDEKAWPVFVHCQHGSDRTGLMCAMYRVVVQGWSKEEAIAEMTRGGMGFNTMLGSLATYVTEADVAEFRRRVGQEKIHKSKSPQVQIRN